MSTRSVAVRGRSALLALASAPLGAGAGAATRARTTLPPITVTAQKEPDDPQNLPVSVTAVLRETLDDAGVAQRQRRRLVRAEHVLQRVHRAQAEQRALPRRRLQPEPIPA